MQHLNSLITTRFGNVGLLLFVGLLGWVGYTVYVAWPFSAVIPHAGGPEVRDADPDMPNTEMKEAVSKANGTMESLYRSAHSRRWLSKCADWVSFLLTAVITVIVGSTGQVLQNPAPPPLPAGPIPPAAASLGQKWLRWIGVIGAIASVMIAASGLLGTEGQAQVARADELNTAITKARTDYATAVGKAAGQNVVDELRKATRKAE